MTERADILICGGGIIGLTLAKELLAQGYENIVVLEKTGKLGEHASGRNSGVLHAGIYYPPDSLKARFCLRGNLLMKEYCRQKHIPLIESGKVIVTRNTGEIPLLKDLFARSERNRADAELIDEERLETIEPYAMTRGLALFSPHTAVVDPHAVLACLENDLVSSGKVTVLRGVAFQGVRKSREVITSDGRIAFDLFINTSGTYSDTIAHQFGVGLDYRVLPFKGTYRKLRKEKNYLVKGNIYPVPDARNPFLGVHFTRVADGTVYIGPTAIPAFGREHYGTLQGLDRELPGILYRDLVLFLSNHPFRKVALTEPARYFNRFFFEEVKPMVRNLNAEDIEPSDKIGIRPQLVDWKKKELVMDFLVLKSGESIHILNAVSPGFTGSMAFAEYIVKQYVQ